MPTELLRDLGAVAGIGGIAIGIFFLLGRQVIARNLFPRLTQKHAFLLLSTIIWFAFLLGIAGIVAYVFVSSKTQPSPAPETPTPIVSKLFIDRVEQVSSSQLNDQELAFDITLRNPSTDPINVTQMSLYFNSPDQANLLLIQDPTIRTGDYQITITDSDSAHTVIPDGTQYSATIQHSKPNSIDFIIETPISQTLKAGAVDKYRVSVVSDFSAIILSELKTVKVKAIYNNAYEVWSVPLHIRNGLQPG
jgi:hypothetical protein